MKMLAQRPGGEAKLGASRRVAPQMQVSLKEFSHENQGISLSIAHK
jgi:hypothetical protein